MQADDINLTSDGTGLSQSTMNKSLMVQEGVHPVQPENDSFTKLGDMLKDLPKSMMDTLMSVLTSGGLGGLLSTFLGGAFKDSLLPVTERVNSLKEGAQDQIDKVLGGSGILTNLTGKSLVPVKRSPKSSDLLKLSASFALPALLVNDTLTKIYESMSQKNGKSTKDTKSGGSGFKDTIKNLFKNIGNGVAGLAILAGALVAFAAASAIFSKVEWGKALMGLAFFAAFVFGSLKLAEYLNKVKGAKLFKDFAMSVLLLAGAFAAFSVAVFIAGSIPWTVMGQAVVVLAGFVAFAFISVALANTVKKGKGSFKDFAMGSILLASSLIVFSAAIFIAGSLPTNKLTQGAIVVAAIMGMLFLVGVGMKLVKSKDLMEFAKASALLGIGLLIMTGVVFLAGSIPLEKAIQGGIVVAALLFMLIIVSKILDGVNWGSTLLNLGLFALGAILLGVALTVLLIPFKLAGTLELASIGWVAGILVASMAIFFLIPFFYPVLIMAIPALFLFTIASVLLSTSLIALSTAIKSMPKEEVDFTPVGSALNGAFGLMSTIIFNSFLLLGAQKPLLRLSTSLWLINSSLKSLFQITKTLSTNKIDFDEEMQEKLNTSITGIAGFLGLLSVSMKDIKIDKKLVKKVEQINNVISPLAKCINSAQSLSNYTLNTEVIKNNLDTIVALTASISGKVYKVKNMDSLTGMIEVMDSLFNLQQRLADVNDPAKLETARVGLKNLGSLIATDDSTWSLEQVLYQMSYIKAKSDSVQALLFVTQTMDSLIDLVLKIKDNENLQPAAIQASQGNMESLSVLITSISKSLKSMKSIPEDATKTTKSIIEIMNLFKNNGSVFEVIRVNGTGEFKKSAKNFAQGLSNLSSIKSSSVETIKKASVNIEDFGKTFSTVVDGFERVKSVGLGTELKPLLDMANRTKDFEHIAEAFERIGNQASNMAKSTAVFQNLNQLNSPSTMAGANGRLGDTVETDMSAIRKLLETWSPYVMTSGGEVDENFALLNPRPNTAALEPRTSSINKGQRKSILDSSFMKFITGRG